MRNEDWVPLRQAQGRFSEDAGMTGCRRGAGGEVGPEGDGEGAECEEFEKGEEAVEEREDGRHLEPGL